MTTLAADIGGTSVKLGLVDAGRVVARDRLPVADRTSMQPLLGSMASRWRAMLDSAGKGIDGVTGVAMAFAGVVDPRAKRIISINGKYFDATSIDLRQWAEQTLGLGLWIDNDARTALVGEWRAGAGRGCDDLVMVTLGTGIGAAAVIDGRVLRGSHGMAGLFGGHLIVDRHGRRCTCGNVGCAEAEASTDRLRDIVDALAAQHGTRSPWADQPDLNYIGVFEQADAGDELARTVRDHSIAVWSAAVVNLIHAYGPRRVVIGGGVAHGSPMIVDAIGQAAAHLAWTPWGRVEVRLGELGDDAALIGGGFLQHEQQESESSP